MISTFSQDIFCSWPIFNRSAVGYATKLHQTASEPNSGHLSDIDIFERNDKKNNTGHNDVYDVPKLRFAQYG